VWDRPEDSRGVRDARSRRTTTRGGLTNARAVTNEVAAGREIFVFIFVVIVIEK